MTDDQFRRKRELCEQVLKVFDKIMPGRNRKRGQTLGPPHRGLVSGGFDGMPNMNKKSFMSCIETLIPCHTTLASALFSLFQCF